MPSDKIEKLTEVLLERYRIQRDNPDDTINERTGEPYTDEDLITFAVDEAWQNGELDFLTGN